MSIQIEPKFLIRKLAKDGEKLPKDGEITAFKAIEPKFLTCRDMEKRFGVPQSLIRKLAKDGKITAFKASERCTLFLIAEFEEKILGIKQEAKAKKEEQ